MIALIKSYEFEAGTRAVSLLLLGGCQHAWFDFDRVWRALTDLIGFYSYLLTFSLAKW